MNSTALKVYDDVEFHTNDNVKITIDPDLKELIPPLAEDEYRQLEQNILAAGCRDALVLWRGILIDGHNRYEICQRHNIPFSTKNANLKDRSAVEEWMILNQFGRRNLPPYQRTKLALRLEVVIAARAKANQVAGLKQGDKLPVPQISAKRESPVDTRAEIAKIAGVSHDTVAKVKKIERDAAPEIKQALSRGELSINEVYTELKKTEKKEAREKLIAEQREAIETGTVSLPTGKYEVIAMDPPWNYGREYDPDSSRVANPYPEMTQDELLEMDPPFADDAVLFLWTTHQFIWDAKALLDKWGFTYKANLVWDKESLGMGSWLRMQCEFCLVGIKGKPMWENTKWRDVIREKRREHSRKPDTFYQMVQEITAGRRLEYFSRERREGWETFGNDQDKF